MTRLEQRTIKRVGEVCLQLRSIARNIEPARPLLGPLLRNLTTAIETAAYTRDGNFVLTLPDNTRQVNEAKRVVVQLAND